MLLRILKYLFVIAGSLLVIKGFLHDNDIRMLIGVFIVVATFAVHVFGFNLNNKKKV